MQLAHGEAHGENQYEEALGFFNEMAGWKEGWVEGGQGGVTQPT